jgi:hypothetical protein
MGQQCAAGIRRVPLSRFALRAVVLAALGTGLWLGSQATASAEEISPPPTAGATSSSAVGQLVAPGVGLVRPVVSAVASATPSPAPFVAPAAGPAESAVTPILMAAEPVLEVARPLGEVAAPVVAAVQDVAAPVVAAGEPVVAPVANAVVPAPGALDSLPARAIDAPALGPGTGVDQAQEPTDTGSYRPTRPVHGSATGTTGAGSAMSPAGDGVPGPGPRAAGDAPVPVPPPTPATGGPARAASSGAQSVDHWPAYLPATDPATITAALVVTGDARNATGDVAFDPSFSPD